MLACILYPIIQIILCYSIFLISSYIHYQCSSNSNKCKIMATFIILITAAIAIGNIRKRIEFEC